jgi:hypothetical protein
MTLWHKWGPRAARTQLIQIAALASSASYSQLILRALVAVAGPQHFNGYALQFWWRRGGDENFNCNNRL